MNTSLKRISKHATRSKRNEGAVMLVVMLVIVMSTAVAAYSVHSTMFEIRSAGHIRQSYQTQYTAESGLNTMLGLVDRMGPQSLLYAIDRTEAYNSSTAFANMGGFEPNLVAGKRIYRLDSSDFANAPGRTGYPVEDGVMTSGNTFGRGIFKPSFRIEVTDDFVYTGVTPGDRADGYGKLRYLYATYTSRGRTVRQGYTAGTTADTRSYHEGASDARAYAMSGPFGR